MFESKELTEITQQLKVMSYILQDVLRILREINDDMPRCICKDERAVGETWTCVFHGTKTRVE